MVTPCNAQCEEPSLPETPLEAATRRIESVLAILDDWDDGTTDMGGDEDEDGREDLAKIRRMKCHLRRALKDLGFFDDLAQRPCLDPRAFRRRAAWYAAPLSGRLPLRSLPRRHLPLLLRTDGGATRWRLARVRPDHVCAG